MRRRTDAGFVGVSCGCAGPVGLGAERKRSRASTFFCFASFPNMSLATDLVLLCRGEEKRSSIESGEGEGGAAG